MRAQRPLVRASDIGLWAYCHRAWWLHRVKGAAHQRPARLAHGVAVHEAHSHTLRQAHSYRQWAYRLVALALMLLGLAIIIWLSR
jgi:hypothetical protein